MSELFDLQPEGIATVSYLSQKYTYCLELPLEPMGKPRMTNRDRWGTNKRPKVQRYHAFRDNFRLLSRGRLTQSITLLSWVAFFPIPKSYSKKKKIMYAGRPHYQKPDRDNIDKAILDCLEFDDKQIYGGEIYKFWDDGKGSRIHLFWNG